MKKLLVFVLLLLFVSQAAQKPVVVGSKLDAEAQVLGQMIRLTLNDMGLSTQDKTALGDTGVLRKAILSGEVDVYPEYTGNAFYLFPEAKISTAQASNKNTIYKLARDLDAKNGITWLVPANVNNTWVISVTKTLSQRAKLVSVADLAKYLNGGGEFKIAGSPEFFNREDTFPMFEKVYGFKLRDDQKVVLAGATPTQTQQAASNGTSGINGAMAYGTDATLGALGMVALTDPKGAQFVYQPSPIIRTSTLRANPQIAARLNRVFATLNASALIRLNGQIALEGRPAAEVAASYLKSKNLIK
ncbi:MAG: glycine betaine ABC transporter substrate-binding protein [Deinococcales bacterium]